MLDIKITDVRSHAGDSAFLIDDGKTAVLCDTGFGFTGSAVANNIKKALGERTLDYIFLTHSHYDHALGSVYILDCYPNAKVVAGEYAARIFAKDSAKALMRDLDRKFAKTCGVEEYEDLVDNLHVDIALQDGDTVKAGDMTFTAVALPGHTKCSFGFYLVENKMLISSETLGVYDGDKTILPAYLVGYNMALDSIAKAKSLDIECMMFPHLGYCGKEKTDYFLARAAESATEDAEAIADILRSGKGYEAAEQYVFDKYYHGRIKEIYPIDAMKLNTSITVKLIDRELVSTPETL